MLASIHRCTARPHALALAASMCVLAASAVAQSAVPAPAAAASAPEDARKGESDERAPAAQQVTVTGTRLRGGDKATPLTVITSEDILRGGYSSIEDVFRKLPQNLASMSSSSVAAATLGGDTAGRIEFGRTRGLESSLGVSSINLRGLGSGATLILVNGVRRSGSAQDAGGYTDISSIPISQIERIEILTDGASAIYGADAVGGVVNIILRSDYGGGDVSARVEHSSKGAHQAAVSLAKTFGWGSGSLSAALHVQRERPADMSAFVHTGPTGLGDMTDIGGVNTRTRYLTTPAHVFEAIKEGRDFYVGDVLGRVPDGQDGSNVRPGDLLAADPNASTYFAPQIGPKRALNSLRMDLRQGVAEGVELVGSAGFSLQRNDSIWQAKPFDLAVTQAGYPNYATLIRRTNPYNQFRKPVFVGYSYQKELEGMTQTANENQRNVDASIGLHGPMAWFKDGWRFDTVLSASRESGSSLALGQIDSYSEEGIAKLRAVTDQLNLFSDGSDPAIIAHNRTLLMSLNEFKESTFNSRDVTLDLSANGALFDLPAGPAELSTGLQFRRDANHVDLRHVDTQLDSTRSSASAFAELGLPLVKDASWAKRVTLTLAARHERFSQAGDALLSNTSVDWNDDSDLVPLSGIDLLAWTGLTPVSWGDATPPTHLTRNHGATSPLARISWQVNDALNLRATWGRSFLAPTVGQLYGSSTVSRYDDNYQGELPAGIDHLMVLSGSNANLKPQVAVTRTVGVDWRQPNMQGLQLAATLSDVRFKNYIGSLFGVLSPVLAVENRGKLPSTVTQMGDNGVLLLDDRNINLAERYSRALDLSARYTLETESAGTWYFSSALTRTLALYSRLAAWSPEVPQLDTEFGPPKLAGNLGAAWEMGSWTANLTYNYTGGFRVTDPFSGRANFFNMDTGPNPNPQTHAGSMSTIDAQVGYQFETGPAWWGDVRMQLGAQNVFNRKPPFVDNFLGYQGSQFNPRGRVVYFAVQKAF